MDVAILSGNAIRIKSKSASVIINPSKETNKTEVNAVINLNNNSNFSDLKMDGSKITIKGPGEYEVSGIKVKAQGEKGNMVAKLDIELVKILVGSGDGMEKLVDKIENVDILVVNADRKFNFSSLTGFDAKIILAHGELSSDLSKALGKSNAEKVSKHSTTIAKLPSEPQYFLLG